MVAGGNSQTKISVSDLFDEGKAKCRAHCSNNKSGRIHNGLVEYAPKQVCIVGEDLTLTAHLEGNSLIMKK
jgi:hypothetical protein